MRIAILGTGSLGSLFAARLAATGTHELVMAGTWEAAIERVRAQGLRLADGTAKRNVAVPAIHRDRLGAERFDLVLVLVKSWQTAAVAPFAARAADDRALVVTLQNGLGNAEALASHLDPRQLVVGVTTVGASLDGPGRVRAGGNAGPTTLAPFAARPEDGDRLDPVCAVLADAGLPCRAVADWRPPVWRKLAVSCALNPLAALAGVANGALVATPERRALVRAVGREVARVASALDIDLERDGGDAGERAVAVARATADNRNSMLQDAEAGRRTEIDALSGAVVAAAERIGLDPPLNRALAERVAACARTGFRRGRGFSAVQDLLESIAA